MEESFQMRIEESLQISKVFYKIINENNKIFNIEAIMEHLRTLIHEKIIIKEICSILKEERVKINLKLA